MYLGLQLVCYFLLFWKTLVLASGRGLRLESGDGAAESELALRGDKPSLCNNNIVERGLPSSETC